MKQTRKIRINPESTLLHTVGKCGMRPFDEDELLAQGYALTGLHAEGSVATFIYEKDEDDGSQNTD